MLHERMQLKEQEQLAALRAKSSDNATSSTKPTNTSSTSSSASKSGMDRDFEGGFGGQEDLEDRYATTSGEH